MFTILIALPLLYAEMRPLQIALVEQEAKQQDHTEKIQHYGYEDTHCSCVAYARIHRPDVPFINASDVTISTTTPFVGAVVKMYYPHSGMYHLAYVESVGDGYIDIVESNYKPCSVTKRRVTLPDRVLGYL